MYTHEPTGAMRTLLKRPPLRPSTSRPTWTITTAVTCLMVLVATLLTFAIEEEILMGRSFWGFLHQRTTADAPLTPVTLVTSYFPVPKGAKHSLEDYRKWMSSFLPHVEAPLVVYLPPDPQVETIVRELRGALPLQIVQVRAEGSFRSYVPRHG